MPIVSYIKNHPMGALAWALLTMVAIGIAGLFSDWVERHFYAPVRQSFGFGTPAWAERLAETGALFLITFLCIGSVAVVAFLAGRHGSLRAGEGAQPAPPSNTINFVESPPVTPDWSIKELFEHIRSDYQSDYGDERVYETVSHEVLKAFTTKGLLVWGIRMPGDGIESTFWPNDRPPADKIPPSYWQQASFTYAFFSEGNQFNAHTSGNYGQPVPRYCDLEVNKAQALTIWPQSCAARAGFVSDLSVQEAVEEFEFSTELSRAEALALIEQRAADGTIRAWGGVSNGGTLNYEEIDAHYWQTHAMHARDPFGTGFTNVWAGAKDEDKTTHMRLRVCNAQIQALIQEVLDLKN